MISQVMKHLYYPQIRTLVSILPSNNEEDLSEVDCTDDLNRMCAGIEGYTGDTAAALTDDL